MSGWLAQGIWLFAASWTLAQLEIQIEGPHGWAEKLPTWRWESPFVLKLTNGKAVTGYHVYMNAFLLAMLHLPLVFEGFSRRLEARVLALYFFMTFIWDFQWFVWNPAWGLRRYFSETIPWFPRKVLGFPADYYAGAAASFALQALLWPQGLGGWLRVLAVALALSAASAALSRLLAK